MLDQVEIIDNQYTINFQNKDGEFVVLCIAYENNKFYTHVAIYKEKLQENKFMGLKCRFYHDNKGVIGPIH